MLCYDPKQRITIAQLKKHPWFNGKYLEGKELIRALRHRHREMEAKRRRDARKIKDLQVSITPNRALGNPKVPEWNDKNPEQVLSNSYAHFKEPKKATMVCTISKMEKSTAAQNAKSVQMDYKFEVSLFKSKQYAVNEQEAKSNNDVDVDDQTELDDDVAHSQSTNKENIYVVTTKRLA